MIEVDVHQQLREFLREQGEPHWPHHLTLARLVARALRLQRHALLQVGSAAAYQGNYRLSYLTPLLLSAEPAILVAPEVIQQRLLRVDLPRLTEGLRIAKPLQVGDCWPGKDYRGLLLTTPASWLADYLQQQGRFPVGINTVVDGADQFIQTAQEQLTITLTGQDWEALNLAYPQCREQIRDVRVQILRQIFQHPANPYECVLLDTSEQSLLRDLLQFLGNFAPHPAKWGQFWQHLGSEDDLGWVEIQRAVGQFSLHLAPVVLAEQLRGLWQRQAVVLLGGSLDPEAGAEQYRQQIGLDSATCLKFANDRQSQSIQLYLPERMPLPNTPEFQPALLHELEKLLYLSPTRPGMTVLIVEDLPLRGQVAATLAASFGSRVQLETTAVDTHSILVTGWQFWQHHQPYLPPAQLLVIATLPIPSLEDPRVAGRVAYYKRLRLDWFRQYLLPEALGQLERAIAPLREQAGAVALLDLRVSYRNYGHQFLEVLSPYLRLNYLSADLFACTP